MPTAGTAGERPALAMALDIARRHGARVSFLHVAAGHAVASPHELAGGTCCDRIAPTPAGSALRRDADRMLRRIAAPFVAAGVAVAFDIVSGGRARAIVEIACRRKVDLVVMMHDRAPDVGGRPGSATADHVVVGAPCAVMVVKRRRVREARRESHPICAEIW